MSKLNWNRNRESRLLKTQGAQLHEDYQPRQPAEACERQEPTRTEKQRAKVAAKRRRLLHLESLLEGGCGVSTTQRTEIADEARKLRAFLKLGRNERLDG